MNLSAWLHFLIAAAVLVSGTPTKRYYDTHAYYALEYIHYPESGISLDDVAGALGVEVVEQGGELRDVWLVRVSHPHLKARNQALGHFHDAVIHALENLRAIAHSHIEARSEERIFARKVTSSVKFLERQIPRMLEKRAPPPLHTTPTPSSLDVAHRLGLKDPLFPEQWHLFNEEYPQHSMNTTPVWDMGFTGKGVFTSFLDDGLDFEHDDLKDAFDAENSYDFNEHVALPRPVTAIDDHGTRCAGQVAARRNDACGVGIAYEAKAAGVRILGGPITYVDEASALNYGFQQVSIYSCSWGPRDDGRRMDGPGYLVRKAVVNGINEGRDGKGSIFVFASGNGGDSHDQCNFDGYTNSIYSITVSTVDYKGLHPSYSEACAANLVVAYSSGSGKHIVTTDRSHNGDNKCTYGHSGTSAAAPNAVGVFTLALQARPELTWRDIQHLCVETARVVDPEDHGWERTAAGRLYNNKFGYGALDAYAYVKAAQTWKLVKPQAWLPSETIQINGGKTYDSGHGNYTYEGGERIRSHGFESAMHITKEVMTENNLESLEHIDVRVWISHSRRGDVEIELISPNGVKSVLAKKRPFDDATTGYPGWRFMTVKHWGEDPVGGWTIRVFDQDDDYERGKFLGWNMVFWGSSIDPAKAVKYQEPIVNNILPPTPFPHRPIVNDPVFTSSTQHAKPTEHLPSAHLTPETTLVAGSQITPTGIPDVPTPFEELVSSQKWYFLSIGAALGLLTGLLFYLWRRRVAHKRLAEYTSLAADDIHMDTVTDSYVVPMPPARGGAPKGVPSYDDIEEDAEPFLPPPTSGRIGLHSGVLDDDETSPSGYRKGFEPREQVPNSEQNTNHGSNENSPWLVIRQ